MKIPGMHPHMKPYLQLIFYKGLSHNLLRNNIVKYLIICKITFFDFFFAFKELILKSI